jgi:hypothetical protein
MGNMATIVQGGQFNALDFLAALISLNPYSIL